MRGLAISLLTMCGVLLAQQQQPPQPAATATPAPPATKTNKESGLTRQKAAIKRQIGDPDENGWFFWSPWPAKVEPALLPPAIPAPVEPVTPPAPNP